MKDYFVITKNRGIKSDFGYKTRTISEFSLNKNCSADNWHHKLKTPKWKPGSALDVHNQNENSEVSDFNQTKLQSHHIIMKSKFTCVSAKYSSNNRVNNHNNIATITTIIHEKRD